MSDITGLPQTIDIQVVCDKVATLTDTGRPEDALVLVDRLRAGGDTFTGACAQERLDAVAATAAPSGGVAGRTLPEQAEQSWNAFHDDYVDPSVATIAPFLATVLVMLVLARLAVAMPWGRLPRSREQRSTDQRQGFAWALGASALATLALPRLPSIPGAAAAFFALAAAVVAVNLLSQSWAAALRLRVEVVDGDGVDRGASGHLAALIAELGADRPRGLEVPAGTDVEALTGTTISVPPTGSAALAVYRAVHVLVPREPWRVRVDVASEDVMTVTVTRLGRPVTSVVVDRDALGLRLRLPSYDGRTRAPDLYRVAAAVALTALADQHADAEDGMFLCGARDWRSVGLHAVATLELAHTPEQMVPVLAHAVDLDADNAPAQVALWNVRFRHAVEARDLDEYIGWLTTAVDRMRGRDAEWTSLRLRLRHSLAATTVNRLWVGDDGSTSPELDADAVAATEGLVQEIATHRDRFEGHGAPPLAREMWPVAAAMYLTVHRPGDRFWDVALAALEDEPMFAPTARYAYACYLASTVAEHGEETRDERDARAVAQLRLADVMAGMAHRRETDPQLARLRTRLVYVDEFGAGARVPAPTAGHGADPRTARRADHRPAHTVRG